MTILAADENPLIPPLSEIIIGVIAFSVVVIVMMRYVAPRFEQVFRARREAIEGGIERAEAMQAEAKASGKFSVVYRRRGYDYGVIRLVENRHGL